MAAKSATINIFIDKFTNGKLSVALAAQQPHQPRQARNIHDAEDNERKLIRKTFGLSTVT